MTLHFHEDVLEPQPTMGKELFDLYFPIAFWVGVVATFADFLVLTITGDLSTGAVGLMVGTSWFASLAFGLGALMVDGFIRKRYEPHHRA